MPVLSRHEAGSRGGTVPPRRPGLSRGRAQVNSIGERQRPGPSSSGPAETPRKACKIPGVEGARSAPLRAAPPGRAGGLRAGGCRPDPRRCARLRSAPHCAALPEPLPPAPPPSLLPCRLLPPHRPAPARPRRPAPTAGGRGGLGGGRRSCWGWEGGNPAPHAPAAPGSSEGAAREGSWRAAWMS